MHGSIAKAHTSATQNTLGTPVVAHWHAGSPSKGCKAACGFAFPAQNTQPKITDTCTACLDVLFQDTLTVCECAK